MDSTHVDSCTPMWIFDVTRLVGKQGQKLTRFVTFSISCAKAVIKKYKNCGVQNPS